MATSRIAAIVLAAGGSRRLGTPKQLMRYEGESLVRRAVRSARTAEVDAVIVVAGGSAEQVLPEVRDMTDVIVVNSDWATGLASSCVAGIWAVQTMYPACDGVLLTVIDQPLVDGDALRRLRARFDGTYRIVAAAYDEVVGVPAIVGREFFPELLTLSGESGAGRWIRAQGKAVVRVSMPEAAFDVDTPDDAAQLSQGRPGTRLLAPRPPDDTFAPPA